MEGNGGHLPGDHTGSHFAAVKYAKAAYGIATQRRPSFCPSLLGRRQGAVLGL